jgi:adenine-specific DNA methylase
VTFIGDFANWDLSSNQTYLEVGRSLVKAAHPEETPLVVDPFAGGGSIPLEALRLGCDAFASDLNPVACLILKVMLEDIPRHGPELAEELRRVGKEIKEAGEKELAEFYPVDSDGSRPIAYLWARTVRCEAPNCGAEIPLVRSFWLCKKPNRKRALRPLLSSFSLLEKEKNEWPRVEFEIFEPTNENEVASGTVTRAKATCLCCGAVLPPDRVRAQIAAQRGGIDVSFDENGNRASGARLMAVVTLKSNVQGRHYRAPLKKDYESVLKARKVLNEVIAKLPTKGLSPLPDEPIDLYHHDVNRMPIYGMITWADICTCRQLVWMEFLTRNLRKSAANAIKGRDLLPIIASRCVDRSTAVCHWHLTRETVENTCARQALPMVWDFVEGNPFSDSTGGYDGAIEWMSKVIEAWPESLLGQVHQADATNSTLPDASVGIWFTDPPYYDAIDYAVISDFFFVWNKRSLPEHSGLFHDFFESGNSLTPKNNEIVVDSTTTKGHGIRTPEFYEEAMAKAFHEGRRTLKDDGVGCVVFAHKTTEGWEALLSGMIQGGWTITGSWPIATEMGSRLRARDSAALTTSVHLVCRPRREEAPVGDWGDVLRELPKRVGDWMVRLQSEGIRGADLVFACIGPALEIYSRYSKVVDAEEREIPLGGDPEASEPHRRGFLAYVWEVVGRIALEHVLGTADLPTPMLRQAGAKTRDGAAGGLEEDARLTALFLWTLQSTNGNGAKNTEEESEENEEADDEEEESPKKKKQGYSLIFDVARRFAQPLGIHLPEWEGRIIETQKGIVRLLSVKERAKQLFGEEGAHVAAERIERSPVGPIQLMLFPEETRGAAPEIRGRGGKRKKKAVGEVSDEALRARREATTLDRVHAAMLLQASGRANALRALLKTEQDRGPDFLRLANALSALYPKNSEEKRLLDAMLLAMPR